MVIQYLLSFRAKRQPAPQYRWHVALLVLDPSVSQVSDVKGPECRRTPTLYLRSVGLAKI